MSEQQPSSEAKAQELFDQGKLAFNKGEYETSVTKLGEACQLLDQLNGDLAPANGDAYFLYGQALLQFAIQQNTVLGQSAQASATKVEEQQEIAKEEEVESKNPLFQLSGVPEFKQAEEEEEEEDDEEDDEADAGNTADEDFETAWDILDVARLIFEKGEDNKSKLNLADVHLCLGDVSLETEKFNEALSDYEKAIEIKQSVLEDDNRELAEAHYKYALALEFSTEKADQALPELQKAVNVLKKRISNLEAGGDGGKGKGKGKGKATDIDEKALEEIKEINELIPDMELKIEELATRQATEKEAEAMLKAMLGFTKASTELTASTPVNDLSTLVKRKPANDVSSLVKRKADQVATKEGGEKEGEEEVKKPKLD